LGCLIGVIKGCLHRNTGKTQETKKQPKHQNTKTPKHQNTKTPKHQNTSETPKNKQNTSETPKHK
jgi:hypothetical protein